MALPKSLRINTLKSPNFPHCLYISYDGLLDPLGQSQILPYILGLAEVGFRFTIISFEKLDRDPQLIEALSLRLKSKNISWIHLPFVHGRFQGLFRILRGSLLVRQIAKKDPFELAHMRAIVPAVIYRLSLINRPFIYDIRAFTGQWVDGGRLRSTSIAFRLLASFEHSLICKAAGLVVLDQSGAEYLLDSYNNLPLAKVIPTSTDLDDCIACHVDLGLKSTSEIRFVFLGGARFPYLPLSALRFVQILISYGFDCSIDFINERDHALIEMACKSLDFPQDRFRLFSLPPEMVRPQLNSYDCGLVFIADGPWIRMSSPTKIGEYLAAGLHVIGLSGIAVLDRLALQSTSVDVINRNGPDFHLSEQEASELVSCIKSPSRFKESRMLAEKLYDRSKAVAQYVDLYLKVFSIG